ncbi:protein arginine kinase [Acetoanaerobium pronyense]|uniref:Protein-arginine kinase n=1 Tax=Acetoanaerobium pronyense TaxID=1482736 RepID=A0ABS4KJK1_9FIRM|nr:protein arginine kinase [Acetoanaerobium pronyense]MBP2027939.1 protein arginine kinase [Acetoanaerobium pronyense]
MERPTNEEISRVVVSSRVRLARNLKDYPFPNKIDEHQASELVDRVVRTVKEGNTVLKDNLTPVIIKNKSMLEKEVLLEKHLISKELLNENNGAALIQEDETISIMINEEDHLRIQVLMKGLSLLQAYDLCDKVDDVLEERLKYAFSENLGYLTACPTNIGTGLRASVMLHLPALVELGYMGGILESAGQIGLAVRGLYGEGTKSIGSLFQISNQLTLGRKEEEIVGNIIGISKQIVERELEAEKILRKRMGLFLDDRISRSLGILRFSKVMGTEEAMNHLSNIKIGIGIGIVKGIENSEVDNLMIKVQPANQAMIAKEAKRDDKRADYLREAFKNVDIN